MAGDLISRQYSGTASVLTKYTLKGYQNLYDKIEQKMISVKRWKKQTFTDDFKEECILILQGVHKDESDSFVKDTLYTKALIRNQVGKMAKQDFSE
jgi:inorganic triphosphatase YgiF